MNKHWHRLLALAASTAVLSACGGGGTDSTPPDDSHAVPASAGATSGDYARYAAALAPTDTGLPLTLDQVNAPTSETEVAQPL